MKRLRAVCFLLHSVAWVALAQPALAQPAQAGAGQDSTPATANLPPPEIFLTWHAPFGQPGATDTLSAVCDSTRLDTLWLAFDPHRKSPTFLGFSATLLIHPRLGDSLSARWTKDYGTTRPGFVSLECDPSPGLGYPQPYRTNGGGGTIYEEDGASGSFRMVYTTPLNAAVGIVPGTYALARVVIRRSSTPRPGCQEPICIEWAEGGIGFGFGVPDLHVFTGAHRFVSLNSPGGGVCVPYRKAGKMNWTPTGRGH
jgi:hypothetical protein